MLVISTKEGEGNGNPLQYSCLENPRDGEAWWGAVYGVAQSLDMIERLSSSSSTKKELMGCKAMRFEDLMKGFTVK